MEKNVHREIERKFLVKGAFKSEAFQAVPILQGYLSSGSGTECEGPIMWVKGLSDN